MPKHPYMFLVRCFWDFCVCQCEFCRWVAALGGEDCVPLSHPFVLLLFLLFLLLIVFYLLLLQYYYYICVNYVSDGVFSVCGTTFHSRLWNELN